MSVSDSLDDRAAAAATLSASDDEQLLRELAHWSVRAQDLLHADHDLKEELAVVGRDYQVSAVWLSLITEEMRSRKIRAAAGEDGAGPGTADVPAAFRQALGE